MSSFNTIYFCWFPISTPSFPCSCPTEDPSTLSGHLSAFMSPVSYCVPVPFFFYFGGLWSSTPCTHCNTRSYAHRLKMWAMIHTWGRDKMCDLHLSELKLLCLILYPFSFKGYDFIFLYSWIKPHCIFMPQFHYLFNYWQMSALPPLPYYSE